MESNSIEETFIYGLLDPRTNALRYIGKSNNPEKRLISHNQVFNNTHKECWLQSLHKINLKPVLKIIDIVPKLKWQQYEIFWIAYYKKQGADLTNGNPGGFGGGTYTPEIQEKLRISRTGQKRTGQALQNLREASIKKKGSIRSKEVRQKMSKAKKGKPVSQEVKDLLMKYVIKKPILQYNLTGIFISEYESTEEAARTNDFKANSIRRCLRQERHSYKKFIWKFKKEEELQDIDY